MHAPGWEHGSSELGTVKSSVGYPVSLSSDVPRVKVINTYCLKQAFSGIKIDSETFCKCKKTHCDVPSFLKININ